MMWFRFSITVQNNVSFLRIPPILQQSKLNATMNCQIIRWYGSRISQKSWWTLWWNEHFCLCVGSCFRGENLRSLRVPNRWSLIDSSVLCENCALKSRVGVAICSVEFSAVLLELHCVGDVCTYFCCCGVMELLPWRFIKLPGLHYFPELHCAIICGWYNGRIVDIFFRFLSFCNLLGKCCLMVIPFWFGCHCLAWLPDAYL